MALTKQDLKDIVKILQPQFSSINTRFNSIDRRLDGLDKTTISIMDRVSENHNAIKKLSEDFIMFKIKVSKKINNIVGYAYELEQKLQLDQLRDKPKKSYKIIPN